MDDHKNEKKLVFSQNVEQRRKALVRPCPPIQSRRHVGGGFGGLIHIKLQAPHIETWNTIDKWSFG